MCLDVDILTIRIKIRALYKEGGKAHGISCLHHVCQHTSLASKTLAKTEGKAAGKSSVLMNSAQKDYAYQTALG